MANKGWSGLGIKAVAASGGAVLAALLLMPAPAHAAVATADLVAPAPPSSVSWVNSTVTSLGFKWTPATDNVAVQTYTLYRDGNPLAVIPSSTTSFTDSGLWPHSTHTYYVKAHDAAGNVSKTSQLVTAYTKADIVGPTAPTNFTARFVRSTRTVSMSWGPSTDNVAVVRYQILRELVPVGTTTKLSWTDPTPPLNKIAHYTVQAVDEVSLTSGTSNMAVVATDTIKPSTPGNLRVAAVTPTSVSLGWVPSTDNFSVKSYAIWCNGFRLALQSSAVGTTFYAGGLLRTTLYSCYVVAIDPTGNASAKSLPISITTL